MKLKSMPLCRVADRLCSVNPILLSLILLSAAKPVDAAAQGTARSVSPAECAGLVEHVSVPGVELEVARVNEAAPDVPAHCEIMGAIDRRTGGDGQRYAIRFRLRAPLGQGWNGRFLFSGGGGSNGVVGDGLTVQGTSRIPLADGFAVLTQDSGHDNATNSDPARSGDRAFHFDARAREDNSYRSYGRATVVAKEILNTLYGRYPARSYFAGCSEGGREAVLMSQRYPTYFDGVLAGAPLLEAPQAALVRPAHVLQTYAALAKRQGRLDPNGLPFINQSFSDADLAVLSGGIAKACDGLDGLVDGISQDFRSCTAAFDPSGLLCQAGQKNGCISPDQAEAVRTQMAGIAGDHRWHYDLGTVPGQFRSWWLGPAQAPQAGSLWADRPGTTSYMTPVPAVDMRAEGGSRPFRSWLDFDASRDRGAIFATTREQPQSTWDMMFATNPDITPFAARGGRMVLFHGVADGAFPIAQTIAWLERVDAVGPGRASDFMRLYPVPGMGHCRGGPATSQFDLLSPLVRWTEEGVAPEAVEATAPGGTPWPGRTRPLCAYPAVATYDGSGDSELASSFRCATP